jgi:hypothetical protein
MEIKTAIFYGNDANLEISLMEYGLLVSKETDKDGQHACLYKHEYDGTFDVGYLSEKEANAFLNESWFNKDAFLSWNGAIESEWLELDFVVKVMDLLQYYGYENIFGSSYGDVFSTEEAIEWLNNFELSK